MSIPRLILHQDEVDKVFQPACRGSRTKVVPLEEVQESNEGLSFFSTSRMILQISNDIAQDFVDLPHQVSHKWCQLASLMIGLAVGTAFFFVPLFFVPFNSVNQGLEGNRLFQYGVASYYQFIGILPWIETCNYSMPTASIPLKSRITAVLIGLIIQKIFDVIVAEGLFMSGAPKVFPIPFSTIVSGTLALPFALFSLFLMTPDRKEKHIRQKFLLCLLALFKIVVSIFGAGLWAVVFRILLGSRWQRIWAFTFAPLKFLCKIPLMAPTALQLNPHRYIILQLVIELIFTRVQVATLPYIDGYLSLLFLLIPSFVTLLWRYYSGIDRLGIVLGSFWKKALGDHEPTKTVQRHLGANSVIQMASGLMVASLSDVHEICMTLSADPEFYPDWSVNSIKAIGQHLINGQCERDGESEDPLQAMEEGQAQAARDVVKSLESIEEEHEDEVAVEVEEEATKESPEEDDVADVEEESTMEGHDEDDVVEVEEEKTMTVQDRREAFQRSRMPRPKSDPNKLQETKWFQRLLYHIIDSVGSEILGTIVQVHNLISIALVRNLPIQQHLNETFNVSDERWRNGIIYGWIFVLVNLIIIASLTIAFRRLEKLGDRKLTMSGVVAYIFRGNFWFLFLWLTASGALACVTFINHFGADFTLKFEWLSCRAPGDMMWPGCAHSPMGESVH